MIRGTDGYDYEDEGALLLREPAPTDRNRLLRSARQTRPTGLGLVRADLIRWAENLPADYAAPADYSAPVRFDLPFRVGP